MSFTNNTVASTYKDILQMDNSNSGIGTSLLVVKDGAGNLSCMYLSDDQIKIKPENDDTTKLVDIQDADGNTLFLVDSSNDLLKALGHKLNTQYAYFKWSSLSSSSISANTHYLIPFGTMGDRTGTAVDIGTSTDPDTSLTISTSADDVVQALWYLPDNITIDSVDWFSGADAASGDTIRGHLMSYDIDTSNTSTGGDLSNGVVLADGDDVLNQGYEQIYHQQMTIQSADVDAGKVIGFAFRCDSINADYSHNVIIKYSLR